MEDRKTVFAIKRFEKHRTGGRLPLGEGADRRQDDSGVQLPGRHITRQDADQFRVVCRTHGSIRNQPCQRCHYALFTPIRHVGLFEIRCCFSLASLGGKGAAGGVIGPQARRQCRFHPPWALSAEARTASVRPDVSFACNNIPEGGETDGWPARDTRSDRRRRRDRSSGRHALRREDGTALRAANRRTRH